MKQSSTSADRNNKKLILLELNEINFDVVENYLARSPDKYPAFQKLLAGKNVRTFCEKKYEQIEPWIQWVSVHSGLSFEDHAVFRLGDIVGTDVPQIFEMIEQRGLRVGAVSAMNAENRLQAPSYFIPDPWTITPSDGSWWSSVLTKALSQVVNDNSQARVTASSSFTLVLALLRFTGVRNYHAYLRLIFTSRGAPWRKALVLDLLLHDIHRTLFLKHRTNFSTLFLNAGAHIQHHYFLNAKPFQKSVAQKNPEWYVRPNLDPIEEMLTVYDQIIGQCINIPGTELLVATGLSQKPYDRVKYYYRLKNHSEFLRLAGIKFRAVTPRMTRDFLLEFETESEAKNAQLQLSEIRIANDNAPLFGEIDCRGASLFVTLTYPSQISEDMLIEVNNSQINLIQHVSFVAIKNGMHQECGFAFFTSQLANFAPPENSHVKQLHTTISNYFLD